MMTVERSLFWHQGLFLQPQHFQLLDLSLRSLLSPFQDFIEPYFWGITQLEIQKAALGTRSFNLLKGGFLFPDGAYAVFPGNALLEARPFQEAWVEGGKPLSVFLGIRRWNSAGENVTVLEKLDSASLAKVTTRFVTPMDPDEIRDLHSGGPAAQVKRLYFVLRIFWESEQDELGDYILIPIAQLERVGDQIRLSERFAPPCLTVSSSDALAKLVKEVRDQITFRCHQLEEYKSQRGVQTAEFGSRDMVYLLALRSLNRYVPLLFHLLDADQVHPWAVYGVLRQIVGELSSFSERVNVVGELDDGSRLLANYDHRSLWACFSAAQTLISELLDEITAGPEYVIRLVYDGTYYAAELKPAIFEGRNRFYLVLKTEEDPKLVLQSLDAVVKLSSREHLPILIARALPGIGLEHLSVPPQELPKRAHSIYLGIDHHSDQWGMISKGRNIALYWDNAPDDLEADLMVVSRP